MVVEAGQQGLRAPAPHLLGNLEVRVGPGRDLRQVRDAHDLGAPAQRLQPGADGVGGCPTDAGIDFIEDQGAPGLVA